MSQTSGADLWLQQNFVPLFWLERSQRLDFYMSYESCPLLYSVRLREDALRVALGGRSLQDFLVDCVRAGFYTRVLVDYYYVRAMDEFWGQRHFPHEILVTGHEESTDTFHAWGFVGRKFQEFTIRSDEIQLYSSPTYFRDGALVVLTRPRESRIEKDATGFHLQVANYLRSENPTSAVPVWSDCGDQWGDGIEMVQRPFGIACYEPLRAQAESGVVDVRNFNVLLTHKELMVDRLSAMSEADSKGFGRELDHAMNIYRLMVDHAGAAQLWALLHSNIEDDDRRKRRLQGEIIGVLTEIEAAEERALSALLSESERGSRLE
jgi:hypothetical protein